MGYVSTLWELHTGLLPSQQTCMTTGSLQNKQHIPDVLSTYVASKWHFACSAPCSKIFGVCQLSTNCPYTLPLDMSALSLHAQERSNSTTIATRHLLLMKHKHCASIRHECRDLTAGESQSTEHRRNVQHDWSKGRAWLAWEWSAQQESRESRFFSHVFSSRFVGTHHERSRNSSKISITKGRIQEHRFLSE